MEIEKEQRSGKVQRKIRKVVGLCIYIFWCGWGGALLVPGQKLLLLNGSFSSCWLGLGVLLALAIHAVYHFIAKLKGNICYKSKVLFGYEWIIITLAVSFLNVILREGHLGTSAWQLDTHPLSHCAESTITTLDNVSLLKVCITIS